MQRKKQNLPHGVTNKNDPSWEITLNNTDTHWCPKIFKGLAKLMEACAVVSMVMEMYNSGKNIISTLLMDDDSNTQLNACHSFKEVMTVNGWMDKAEHWPKMKGGQYVADRGKLPIQVHAIDKFLTDPSHCGKSFGHGMYKLEGKHGRELKFTVVNCKRLKYNFNFWHCQNQCESYEVFEAQYGTGIEHHYGYHSWCQLKDEGGWCKYKGNSKLIEETKNQNWYHDKNTNVILYQLVLTIWQHFGTELMLVYHKFMSQKIK